MLIRAQGWVAPGGHILLADTKKNRAMIRGCFVDGSWETILSKRDVFFARRSGAAAQQAGATETATPRR